MIVSLMVAAGMDTCLCPDNHYSSVVDEFKIYRICTDVVLLKKIIAHPKNDSRKSLLSICRGIDKNIWLV